MPMTATTTAAAPPPKLPFWRTIGRAYSAPLENSGALMRAASPWLLVLIPVAFAISYAMAPIQAEMMAKFEAIRPENLKPEDLGKLASLKAEDFAMPWSLQLLALLQHLVTVPAAASIAVAWHRLLLTGTQPATRFLLDRSVGLYTAFLLGVMAFVMVLTTVPQLTFTPRLGDAWIAITALTGIVMIGSVFVLGRWTLVLPAIALGRTDIGLSEAWRTTRGNTWRLFWAPFVCLLIMVPVGFLTRGLSAADRVTSAVSMTLVELFTILAGIVGVGFLSYAYQHFFEGGAEAGRP
jgi:hypothetical protein